MGEEVKVPGQKRMQSPGPSKEDVNRLNHAIQRLTMEVDGTKGQPCQPAETKYLEALQAEGDLGSAKGKLAWLEAALQRTKQDMLQQLREYQELMIVKLGLDFEIATYRKLLELEDSRLGLGFGAETEALARAPACRPSSASGRTCLPTPGACSGVEDTSAPGGGCVLCSNPGCAGSFDCSGSCDC